MIKFSGYLCALTALSLGCAGSKSSPTPPAAPQRFLDEKALDLRVVRTGQTLAITVRDQDAAVRTDLWLYTLENGTLTAFTAFKDPDSKRKSRRLMLPATIGGKPSGLVPSDNGDANGFMSDDTRSRRAAGALVPAIDGEVTVELEAVPTAPIVVVAGLEDQRYAGAAAIDPAGAPMAVPAGVGTPSRHIARTFALDVMPILDSCTDCHGPDGVAEHLALVTFDDVVNFDLAFAEGQAECGKQHAADATAQAACVAALTEVEFLVEPGAPALSPLARRTRPDEEMGASALGMAWFGKGGSRFGGHGDRRMPPQNLSAETTDDQAVPTHFDTHPAQFQILFDWIAQGANP